MSDEKRVAHQLHGGYRAGCRKQKTFAGDFVQYNQGILLIAIHFAQPARKDHFIIAYFDLFHIARAGKIGIPAGVNGMGFQIKSYHELVQFSCTIIYGKISTGIQERTIRF